MVCLRSKYTFSSGAAANAFDALFSYKIDFKKTATHTEAEHEMRKKRVAYKSSEYCVTGLVAQDFTQDMRK